MNTILDGIAMHEERNRHRAARSSPRLTLIALAIGFGLHGVAVAETITGNFSEGWLDYGEKIEIAMPAEVWTGKGELRVFVGKADLTAIAESPTPGKLLVAPGPIELPSGESELVLYRVLDGNWTELAREPIKIRTRAGFDSNEFNPKLSLEVKGRARHEATPDDDAERATYSDLVGNGSFEWAATRGETEFSGSGTVSGNSFRQETLRFSELEARSPKVDLADYQFEVKAPRYGASVGHLTYGNNPLLQSEMSSRGVTLVGRPSTRFDVSLNVMNGTEITGYNNLLGLSDSGHQVNAVTMGLELMERSGGLRAEVSLLDASIRSESDFNAGQIPDAEKSSGFGLRVMSATPEDALKIDLSWASSKYVNPFDPELAQGQDIQQVLQERSQGRILDVTYNILQESDLLSEEHGLGLVLNVHHDRIDPLYKSIGSFFATDQLVNRVGLSASFAGAEISLSASRKKDNLEDIPTLVKTRTDERAFSINLPFAQWMVGSAEEKGDEGENADDSAAADDDGISFWPTLGYTLTNVRQLALNTPDIDDSGFAGSHRPDQTNLDHNLNLSWALGNSSVSYSVSYSDQDTRQTGRETADFKNLGHQVSGTWQVNEGLSTTLALGRTRAHSLADGLISYANDITLGADWMISDKWSMAFNINKTLNSDSDNANRLRNDASHLQVARRFKLLDRSVSIPGQMFLRYGRQRAIATDNIFNFASDNRLWYLDFGVSIEIL